MTNISHQHARYLPDNHPWEISVVGLPFRAGIGRQLCWGDLSPLTPW